MREKRVNVAPLVKPKASPKTILLWQAIEVLRCYPACEGSYSDCPYDAARWGARLTELIRDGELEATGTLERVTGDKNTTAVGKIVARSVPVKCTEPAPSDPSVETDWDWRESTLYNVDITVLPAEARKKLVDFDGTTESLRLTKVQLDRKGLYCFAWEDLKRESERDFPSSDPIDSLYRSRYGEHAPLMLNNRSKKKIWMYESESCADTNSSHAKRSGRPPKYEWAEIWMRAAIYLVNHNETPNEEQFYAMLEAVMENVHPEPSRDYLKRIQKRYFELEQKINGYTPLAGSYNDCDE